MPLCDKRMICVDQTAGIMFNHEYRAMKEEGNSVYIMNDLGQYKWYNKSIFVEKEVMQ